MTNNLIDISEASRRLGVTITTLRRWDKSGKLRSVRTFGNHRRYRLEEIEAIVNSTEGVQTLETLEQERGEIIENDDESHADRPNG